MSRGASWFGPVKLRQGLIPAALATHRTGLADGRIRLALFGFVSAEVPIPQEPEEADEDYFARVRARL